MYAIRLLGFIGPYKRRAAFLLFCIIASSAAIIAMPQLIRWAIDYGLGIEEQGDELVATGEKRYLVFAALAIVGAAIVRGVFAYGQTYLGEWLCQRVAYDIRNGIYDRLQRLSYAYHDQQQTGQLMSRATQDVEAVRLFIAMGVLRGFYVILLMTSVLVLMLITNWKLALVVWAFIPFIAWRSTVMALTLRPLWTLIQEGLARMATVLQEALSGARVVKAFAREEYEGEKFRERGGGAVRQLVRVEPRPGRQRAADVRPLAGGDGGDALGRRAIEVVERQPRARRADVVPALPDDPPDAGAHASAGSS